MNIKIGEHLNRHHLHMARERSESDQSDCLCSFFGRAINYKPHRFAFFWVLEILYMPVILSFAFQSQKKNNESYPNGIKKRFKRRHAAYTQFLSAHSKKPKKKITKNKQQSKLKWHCVWVCVGEGISIKLEIYGNCLLAEITKSTDSTESLDNKSRKI